MPEEGLSEEVKRLKEIALSSQFISTRKKVMEILATYGERAIPAITEIIDDSRMLETRDYGLEVIKKIKKVVEPKSKDDKDVKLSVDSNGKDIFVVHGHDIGRMEAVARFIEQLELNPVILHERPSRGSTIIEKLEKHADVSFAVVLLTPDDVGFVSTDTGNPRPRARQNVILELGYFLGRLGRNKTCALVVGGVEVPSDYLGVVYISLDAGGGWKLKLVKELRSAGLPIDMNKVS